MKKCAGIWGTPISVKAGIAIMATMMYDAIGGKAAPKMIVTNPTNPKARNKFPELRSMTRPGSFIPRPVIVALVSTIPINAQVTPI